MDPSLLERKSRSSRCRNILTLRVSRKWRRSLDLPPLVFAGEARNLQRASPMSRGQGFPAAGRRLRRACRASRRQYSRFLPGVPADGHRADLWRLAAGREGWTHCGPVCKAAPRRSSARAISSCRAIAVTSSTASSSRPRPGSRTRAARRTASRRRHSTSCAPSPRAVSPIWDVSS